MPKSSHCVLAAPVVDAELASLLAQRRNPMESLAPDPSQSLSPRVLALGSSTAEDLLAHGRLALLACGHFVRTKAVHRAACPRCGEMIRAGYDHHGFRCLGEPDTFCWPGDPLRALHEPSGE